MVKNLLSLFILMALSIPFKCAVLYSSDNGVVEAVREIARDEIAKDNEKEAAEKARAISRQEMEAKAEKYRQAGLDVYVTCYSWACQVVSRMTLSEKRKAEAYRAVNSANASTIAERERLKRLSDLDALYEATLKEREHSLKRKRRLEKTEDSAAISKHSAQRTAQNTETKTVQLQPLHDNNASLVNLFLKNGNIIRCYILETNDSGIWVELVETEGSKIYFDDQEIKETKPVTEPNDQ